MSEVVLFRRRISLTSGTGPLMQAQALALAARGVEVELAASRGCTEFFLHTGKWVKRFSVAKARRKAAAEPNLFFVDHSCEVAGAGIAFVHNLHAEAEASLREHLGRRANGSARSAAEAEYFRELRADTPVVANSMLVKRALIERYGIASERIHVHYPGYSGSRFAADHRPRLRADARAALDVAEHVPLIGLVTSGDFEKRGLEIFVAAATSIASHVSGARFLVVGSRRLPDWARRHELFRSGAALYRGKHRKPESSLAALDLLLYPAPFEEFGLVVTEAQALGVPVLTSRRVGASETLPAPYGPWIPATPDAETFAAHALALLGDDQLRSELAAAGVASVKQFEIEPYARASVDTILAARERATQKR